jgi:hypothetical protein
MAAPGQSIASATDCSQNSGATAMAGCEYPHDLCGLNSSFQNSQATFGSLRPNDLLKNALSLLIGEVLSATSYDRAPGRANLPLIEPHKLSIRLFNSILNL